MIGLPEENYEEEPVESPLESVLRREEAMGLKPKQLKALEYVLLSLNVNVMERLVELIGGDAVSWVWWD